MERVFYNRNNQTGYRTYMIFANLVTALVSIGIISTVLCLVLSLGMFGFVVSVVIGIFIMIGMMRRVFNSPNYFVNEQEIIFRTSKKDILNIPLLDNQFSSNVTTISHAPMASNNIRVLIVKGSGKEKRYNCHLSKKDFEEFMALIIHYAAQINSNAEMGRKI